MINYECSKCGMGVKDMKCSKCSKELVHGTITTDTGVVIAVTKCPDGCGMIKSPLCCGQDMTCSI